MGRGRRGPDGGAVMDLRIMGGTGLFSRSDVPNLVTFIHSKPQIPVMAHAKLLLLVGLTAIPLFGCNRDNSVPKSDPNASLLTDVSPVVPTLANLPFFDRPITLAEVRASSEPAPEIVLMERDPWLSVVGSDSPTFVLYENGLVIYRDGESLKSARLSQEEHENVRNSVAALNHPRWTGSYHVALASDQPDNDLLLYLDQPVYLSVYGSLNDDAVLAVLPTHLREALSKLRSFTHSNAREWLPDKIEVMLWPYDNAPDQSIIWSTDWPGLGDPDTRTRGDSYSIFVPSAKLNDIQQFLATKRERGAIEIDGRKFAAGLRIPFPHERLWMAPNNENRDITE